MNQQTLTLVAKVCDGAKLQDVLQTIAGTRVPVGTRDQPAFFADPKLGIHFARLVHIPSDGRFDAWLALESNFDSEVVEPARARDVHIEAMIQGQSEGMRALFSCCDGFREDASLEDLTEFCKRHLVDATATYEGHVARSLARIHLEQRVRDVVLDFVATQETMPRFELFDQIRKHVRTQSQLDAGLRGLDIDRPPESSPDPQQRSDELDAGPPLLDGPIGSALEILRNASRIAEWNGEDAGYDLRRAQESWTNVDRKSFSDLAAGEDYGLQNALTHVVPLKSGVAREDVLLSVHAIINRLSHEYYSAVGALGGIPTIHFAKWLLIDGGKRLVFLSNYDHSWESYLGDFVESAHGLNLAWSCTEKYPKTSWLAFGGAFDEEAFKAWARAYQRPTQVFYSAYPDLSIAVIDNNTWIRYGLHFDPSAIDLDRWFRRLT